MPTPVFWGPEFRIHAVPTGDQTRPKIVSLPDGSFVAVWNSQIGLNAQFEGRLFDAAGNPKGDSFVVNTTPIVLTHVMSIDIAALNDGRFAVTWSNYGPDFQQTAQDVRARVFNRDGTPFDRGGEGGTNDFLVHAATVTNTNQNSPSIAALENGGFVITYDDESQTTKDVRAQAFDTDGWLTGPSEFIVNAKVIDSQFDPDVTALGNGTYVVLYRDDGDSDGTDIRGRIFTADGQHLPGPEFIVVSNSGDRSVSAATVTALSYGRFVVTWQEESSEGEAPSSNIKAQIFEASGERFQGEFLVNETTAHDQTGASITALPDGGFAVTYQDLSVPEGAIRLTTFTNDGVKLGNEIRVDGPHGEASDPTVTALPDGRLVVTWVDSSDGHKDSYARIVDPRFSAITRRHDL
jgi:hypothetical protein